MIFALLFMLALGLLVTLGPAVLFGLVTGLLTARLTVPARIGVLLLVTAAQALTWELLLSFGYLAAAVVFLVGLATFAAGAGGAAWSARQARAAHSSLAGPPYWYHGATGWEART
ncbi:hypothetical protein KCMC57_up02420 [Kitasatospora sp. CMC57]|uniref:Uncharacterized protein n=1 Tax=Kitasatospora sp. CMC57 TaxID=3231513 RepID=A0AB33JKS4_9ACTN